MNIEINNKIVILELRNEITLVRTELTSIVETNVVELADILITKCIKAIISDSLGYIVSNQYDIVLPDTLSFLEKYVMDLIYLKILLVVSNLKLNINSPAVYVDTMLTNENIHLIMKWSN